VDGLLGKYIEELCIEGSLTTATSGEIALKIKNGNAGI